ncbi:MAG: helix-turn-helix transcriptional regulator [Kineosporiaceae bacterium]
MSTRSDRIRREVMRGLRAERSRQGLTQAQLADRLGWSRQKVAAVEAGTRRLFFDDVPDLCAALGVPLSRLLIDADPDDLNALGL